MPDIFTGAAQRIETSVAKVVVNNGIYFTTPIIIQQSGNAGGGNQDSLLDYVLLKNVDFGEQSAIQKNLTLDNSLFLAVFGDKPCPIRLSGFTFARLCNYPQSKSGISVLYDFYKNNTVSVASSLTALDTDVSKYICRLLLPERIILKGVAEALTLNLVSDPFTCYKFTLTMTSIPNFR
jgi:hypothetical protein